MIFNMSTGGASTADKIKYDNTESGLQSTNVQGAVDELNSSLMWQLIGENLSSIDLTQWRFLKIGSIASGVLSNTAEIELSISNDIDLKYLQSYVSDIVYTKVDLTNGTCSKGSNTRSVFWGRK